jgi:CBS domain-containing protein
VDNPTKQHVYRGSGDHEVRTVPDFESVHTTTRTPTVADTVPVSTIMSRDVVCARPDLRVEVLTELLSKRRIGCLPVVDERGRPVGMITKLDVLEPTMGHARVAGEMMMPLAITLDERASVAHAAALMATEDIHHVLVVACGLLVGIVSTMDVVRWLASNDGLAT